MYKKLLFILLIIGFSFLGYIFIANKTDNFKNLSPEEKLNRIISERVFAIEEARLAGNYRCCIEPPCTMCYMEANQWNNYTAGTCACDDLIARGEKACPQCERSLEDIHNKENNFCDISATVANCESND